MVPKNVNDILVVNDELQLIYTFIQVVFKSDPDILSGYDMERKSLYFLAERAWIYGIDLF